MNSVRFLAAWLLGLGFVGLGRPAEAPAVPRPNLVLVVADDLGLTLGCYGDPAARTPNLDQLAKEGVRFTQAFCTTARCSPSRSGTVNTNSPHRPDRFGNGREYPGVQESVFDPNSIRVPLFLPDTPACRAELATGTRSTKSRCIIRCAWCGPGSSS